MVTRVPTYMTRQILTSSMMQVQARLQAAQTQVATEKKSQVYSGISEDAFRLISFENKATRIQRFLDNNAIAETRYKTITDSLGSTESSLRDLRKTLNTFNTRDVNEWTQQDTNDFNQLQSAAFAALKDLEYYLNADVDGNYVFGGGKTDNRPFELGFQDLASFQKVYDGVDVTFPESRAALLSDFTSRPTGAAMGSYSTYASSSALTSLDDTGYGHIDYNAGADTLTARETGAFADFRVGDRILVEDPENPGNSGYMTITAIDGTSTSITVDGDITTTGTSVDATIKRMRAPAAIGAANYDAGPAVALNSAGPPTVYDVTDAAGTNSPFAGLKAGDVVTVVDSDGNEGTYSVSTWTDGDTIQLTQSGGTDVLAIWDGDPAAEITITPPQGSGTEDFGTLTFDSRADGNGNRPVGKLTSSVPGYFSGYEVGMTLTIDGTATNVNGEAQPVSQDGTAYTITGISEDGSTLEVEPPFEAAGGEDANHGPIDYDPADFNIVLSAHRTHGAVDKSTSLNAGVITNPNDGSDILQVTNDLGPAGTGDLAAGDTITLIDADGNLFRHMTLAADPAAGPPPTLQLLNPDGSAFDNTTFATGESSFQVIKETPGTPPFVTGQLTEDNFGTLNMDATAGTIAAGKAGAFNGLSRGMTVILDDRQNPPATDFDGIYTVTDISSDGRTITVEPPPPDGTITNGTDAVLSIGVPEGTRVQVDGSASNDDSYTVTWPSSMSPADRAAALSGQKIFTREEMVSETVSSGTTIASSSYYQGDNLAVTHRADEHRSVTLDVNASDPAIEKAVRALGILAQGVPTREDGTPDPNELQRRLDKASALLGDAIEHPANSTEAASDLTKLQQRVGYDYYAITQTSEQQKTTLSFLDERIGNMENVDMFDAVTRMQDEINALQISYQTYASISQLSLSNYL